MSKDKRIAAILLLVVCGMLSLSFAAVPLYRLFCQVTGYGGTTSVAQSGADEILDQTIRVRFDASLDRAMPWEFQPPEEHVVEINIGDTGLAFYRAHNPTDKPIAGQASFNVAPFSAGAFFVKIECFCFTEQTLMPGETVEMPVTFYVDPDITTHPEAKHVKEITLSYTFYEIDLPEQVTLLTDPAKPATIAN